MKASFIIGFHTARADNLFQTLRFLQRWHQSVVENSEIVTVCQDCADTVCRDSNDSIRSKLNQLCQPFETHHHYDLQLPCMQLPFVTNYGVQMSNHEKIILLESDRILPPGYFAAVVEQLQEGIQISTEKMLRLSSSASDEDIEKHRFYCTPENRSRSNEIGRRNMWSGNTAFMKSDFIAAGKMDESYHGYGWADSDMTFAMETAGVQSIFRDETELHLWHESATYGEGDQKRMFVDNGIRFCRKWNQRIPDWLREDMANYRGSIL